MLTQLDEKNAFRTALPKRPSRKLEALRGYKQESKQSHEEFIINEAWILTLQWDLQPKVFPTDVVLVMKEVLKCKKWIFYISLPMIIRFLIWTRLEIV